MRVSTERSRSKPVAMIWIAAALALGAATLGIIHHASLSRVHKRATAEPVRPIALVELVRNQSHRHGSDSAGVGSDAWRAAAAALGRELSVYSVASLGEIPAKTFAAWILVDQVELHDADFEAIDAYLQLGGGLVLAGRSATRSDGGRSVLEKLFSGRRFTELGAGATRLRVTGASPIVAGLAAGHELAVEGGAHALAANAGDALTWIGGQGEAALHTLHRGGPVAWLGVSPERVSDASDARLLAENGLRWALREPVLDLRAWPEGRPCAVLVEGARSTDSECKLSGADAAPDSLHALAREGCRYAAVPPDELALPELMRFDGGSLVAIPEARADADARGPELMRELLTGYERAERLGGVYSLRADPHWRSKEGRQLLYTRVSHELRERGAWFAAPEELADWWSARSSVHAELSVLARDRVQVTFANSGAAEARGVTARVYLPGGADTARVESAPTFHSAPGLRIAADHAWIEVIEPSLDPGSEVSYTIRF
jgi:hypothetical protein